MRRDPAFIFATAIALFSVLTLWDRSTQCFGLDFYQFWVVGQEIQEPAPAAIYSDSWRASVGQRYWTYSHRKGASTHEMTASDYRRNLQTYSTPLLYTFFSLISAHDYAPSLLRYQLISFACGMVAIAIVGRVLRYSPTTTLMMIAALFGWAEAYRSEIFCANVNQVQFFAIACLMWIQARRDDDSPIRDCVAAALLALIVMFKPNVAAIAVLLGLIWLLQGRYAKVIRYAATCALIAIAIIIVTSLRVGQADCWLQWFGAVHQLEMQNMTPQGENYSLAAVALARIGYSAARAVSIAAPLIAFAIFALRRAPRGKNPIIVAIALGSALSLLASPFAWLHYFVLVGPLFLIVLRPRQEHETAAWYRWRIGIGIVCLIAICLSPIANDLLDLDSFYSRSIRMAGATTSLFLIVLAEFWRDSLWAWPALSLNLFRRNAHVTS